MAEAIREVVLKSGNKLGIGPAPFADSKALYQAILEECRGFDLRVGKLGLFKDAICTLGFSPKVEACLWKCMSRCLYNGLKITPETFEPRSAREDYEEIRWEVVKDNTDPFMKSLFALFPEAAFIVGDIKNQVSESAKAEKTS